jgi:pimeloyl-ACP methyl ester carboxylesterase
LSGGTWTLIHLGVAGVTFDIGLILGLAKPESRPVRHGFAASMIYGCFTLWLALGAAGGALQDSRLALERISSVPLSVIFIWFFAEGLPAPAPSGVPRKVTGWLITGGGLLEGARPGIERCRLSGTRRRGMAECGAATARISRGIPACRVVCTALCAALIVAGSAAVAETKVGEQKRLAKSRAQLLQIPLFTEVPEQYGETDVAALIRIRTPEDLDAKRRALIRLVFEADSIPPDLVAERTGEAIEDPAWNGVASLARIDRLDHRMAYGMVSSMYLLRAKRPAPRLAIYHEGHGAGFESAIPAISGLLDAGCDVIAIDMPVTGRNPTPLVELKGVGKILLDNHTWFAYLDRPLRFFFEPVAAALNFALAEGPREEVIMVGFSGGGWTTTVYAAMDPRIRRSYPVAGSTPLFLRSSTVERRERDMGDFEQIWPDLIRTANYPEMYVMGAAGEGRRQLQVINQFDISVPFRGVKHRAYEEAVVNVVKRMGAGSFEVFLDTSPGAHAFHEEGLARILGEITGSDGQGRR